MAPTSGSNEKMQEVRNTLSGYEQRNIYYVNESRLLYRMGPSRTYLTESKIREKTRGTEFQKHKQRISIVMCFYADVSYAYPVY